MVNVFNSSTWETEARVFEFKNQPGLPSELQATKDYKVRPYLINNQQTNKWMNEKEFHNPSYKIEYCTGPFLHTGLYAKCPMLHLSKPDRHAQSFTHCTDSCNFNNVKIKSEGGTVFVIGQSYKTSCVHKTLLLCPHYSNFSPFKK